MNQSAPDKSTWQVIIPRTPSRATANTLQADKLRTQQQLEALQNKYIGTGHADMTKDEWTDNIVRDSYSSFVGHPPLLYYMSLAQNAGVSMEQVRKQCVDKMVMPGHPLVMQSEGQEAADKMKQEMLRQSLEQFPAKPRQPPREAYRRPKPKAREAS